MRKMILLFGLCTFYNTAFSQARVMVDVMNINNDNGVCRACIFQNHQSFSGNGAPFSCVQAKISNKKAQLIFEKIPEGVYAISVFHDANNNSKFDNNFLGIPKEGYGASRNKLPFASAPRFDENKFLVKENSTTTMNIKLRYL
ncbi:MAG TPA: DUF2141 domain-containing protein [Chitinophagaceae bacterium]|nr:DUF2141 domain-containing protein [Chitinophagaceae bacterium]